jgi:ubiquinone/menaquinone biosynthesis C-methylase UbiE
MDRNSNAREAQLRDRMLEIAATVPGQRILEVANGSGPVTKRLADRVGPTGRLRATDLLQGMINDLWSRLDGPRFTHVKAYRLYTDTSGKGGARASIKPCAALRQKL